MPSKTSRQPRVAFFGNICNNLYQIAKALRSEGDIDAHLYIDRRDNLQMRPESDDPALASGYPEWIHLGNYQPPYSYLLPQLSPLVRELREYDLCVVSGLGPIYAAWCGRPYCFFVSGGDLNCFPFPKYHRFHFQTLRSRLRARAVAPWMGRGIRAAAQILVHPYEPNLYSLAQLGIPPERVGPQYFPVVIDTNHFQFDPTVRDSQDPYVLAMIEDRDFVVFHPSRLMMRRQPDLPKPWQGVVTKMNDVLIRGFAQFVRESVASNPVLVMPDRIPSPVRGNS